MNDKKKKPATKTLSFRLNADVYDYITSESDKRNMSQGEYLLSQVSPESDLGKVLGDIAAKALLSQPAIQEQLVNFMDEFATLKQNSPDNFKELMKDIIAQKISNQSVTNNPKDNTK